MTLNNGQNQNQKSNETDQLHLDKKADIYQALFEHHYRMAMDHHTKAATTSNLLLIIVGSVLVLAGFDDTICNSPVDKGCGIALMIVGTFGALWAYKQHERYQYWKHIATRYQCQLIEILSSLKTVEDYKKLAVRKMNPLDRIFARLSDRWLWVSLHIIIALIGWALFSYASQNCC